MKAPLMDETNHLAIMYIFFNSLVLLEEQLHFFPPQNIKQHVGTTIKKGKITIYEIYFQIEKLFYI